MTATTDGSSDSFEESYLTRIQDAFEDIDICGDAARLREALGAYAEWVGDLVCVHWLLAEVQNGGLMQFFINSTGILAPEAVAGLRRMGLPAAADALDDAIELFGSPYPRGKLERYQILRTKAGLAFEDMEIQMWRAELFKSMEERLEAVGIDKIYARLNEYAKEHAHAPVENPSAWPPSEHLDAETVVKTGTFCYAGLPVCRVRVVQTHLRPGSGERQESEGSRQDRPGTFFRIDYTPPRSDDFMASGGCCSSLEEATKAVENSTQGLAWDT